LHSGDRVTVNTKAQRVEQPGWRTLSRGSLQLHVRARPATLVANLGALDTSASERDVLSQYKACQRHTPSSASSQKLGNRLRDVGHRATRSSPRAHRSFCVMLALMPRSLAIRLSVTEAGASLRVSSHLSELVSLRSSYRGLSRQSWAYLLTVK
jgi:hypothetical protein